MNKNYTKALKLASKKNFDKNQVVCLLEKAIDEGSGEAMYALGTWYLFGEHLEKDLEKANGLFTDAAELCIPEACFDLAVSLEKGMGVNKDLHEAFFYYVKGALYGDADCFEEVGRCYFFGIGVKKDKNLAEIWYEKAKKLGIDSRYESNVIDLDKRKR